MDKKTEALKQALEALELVADLTNHDDEVYAAIDALRKRLEQPEQGPVAWMDEFGNVFPLGAQRGPKHLNEPMKPLYATPASKPWVGLTEEERMDVLLALNWNKQLTHMDTANAIEAKLKEKNAHEN